jgi:hypothetical protein
VYLLLLRQAAAAHPGVSIGSYPNSKDDGSYKVKLAFTGRDTEALAAAVAAVKAALPEAGWADAPQQIA